jgi:hypothetical protein
MSVSDLLSQGGGEKQRQTWCEKCSMVNSVSARVPTNAVSYVVSNDLSGPRGVYYLKVRDESSQGEEILPRRFQQRGLTLPPAVVHYLSWCVQK